MAEKIILQFEVNSIDAQKEAGKLIEQISRMTASRKELNKTLKDLQAEEKRLTELRAPLLSQLTKLEKAGRGNTQSARDLRGEIDKLNQEYDENAAKISKTANELATNNKALTDARGEFRQLNKELGAVDGSLEQQRNTLTRLKREFIKLSPGINTTEEAYENLRKEIKELNDAILEQEQNIGVSQRNVGNYQSAFDGLSGGVISTAKSFVGPGGFLLALGAAKEAIGNAVDAIAEITTRFVKLRGEVQKLTGETGPVLDDLTARLSGVATTFEKDFTEVLISANAVSKQFGITQTEAVSLIEKGFLAGADSSGQFLDVLKEYPGKLRDAGFSAEETISILTQQVKDGVFSDKGIDAIGEAGIKLREMTQSTRDALDGIGLSSTEIEKQLREGTTSLNDVIRSVSKRIAELPANSTEVGAALADIFAGAGEDSGLQAIKTIQGVRKSIDELIDPTNDLVISQQALIDSNRELAATEIEVSKAFAGAGTSTQVLGNQFEILKLKILLNIIEPLKPAREAFERLNTELARVGEIFGIAGLKIDAGRAIIDGLVKAVGFLATGPIKALVRGISGLADSVAGGLRIWSNFAENIQIAGNKLRQLSNDFLGTNFDIPPPEVPDFTPVENAVKESKRNIDDILSGELPAPVPPDYDNIKRAAKEAAESASEEEIKAYEKTQKKLDDQRQKAAERNQALSQREQLAAINLALLNAKEGSKQEFELKKELIRLTSQFEIDASEKTASEIQLIRAKAAKEIAALTLEQKNVIEFDVALIGNANTFEIPEIDLPAAESDIELLKQEIQARINAVGQGIAQETLLYNQQRAQGVADEAAFTQKILALKRERLGLEASLLTEGSPEKLAKLNELAEIEAQIYEDTEERKRNAIDETTKKTIEAEQEKRKAKDREIGAGLEAARAAQQAADAFINLVGEESEAAKKAVIVKKLASAAEVGLNLQREISAYWATNAGVPIIGPGLATALSIAAGARAALSLASIAAFEEGGHTFAGGGNVNSPQIGLIGEKGPEWVAPNWMIQNPKLKPVFSELEGIRQKIRPFADGGLTAGNISQNVANNVNIQNSITMALEKLPAPIVTVTDINKGMQNKNRVQVRANK